MREAHSEVNFVWFRNLRDKPRELFSFFAAIRLSVFGVNNFQIRRRRTYWPHGIEFGLMLKNEQQIVPV